MKPILLLLVAGCLSWAARGSSSSDSPAPGDQAPRVILVVGAPGNPDYGQKFRDWAGLWEKSCQAAGASLSTIGREPDPATNDLDQLKAVLAQEPAEANRDLWLVLIGHGTFDGKEAKFNLRGPDLSASDLAGLLERFHRPLAVIDTSSASAPFLSKLSGPGRVIVTATRSGYEQNYARFGQYFAAAISDPSADLDKDGQVSLLEAYLKAAHDVAEFYKTEGRLATEHALLDDNGDGLGTPPDWFRGVRAVKKPSASADHAAPAVVDGLRANQFHLLRSEAERKLSPELRARRNELELSIEQLRDQKEQLAPDDYYARLEPLMIELARLYQSAQKSAP